MRFSFTTEPATFIERPNRYVVHAHLHNSGEIVRAHCPDPGRLQELLIPGATIHLDRAAAPNRRTTHTLRFVEHPECGQLVSLNTQLPNALFAEGLAQGIFPHLHGYTKIEREVSLPHNSKGVTSRIDFRLSNDQGQICWVETKSASLVVEGIAHFPDAPTLRGRRHLEELMEQVACGQEAAVVFIVQRPDAQYFTPYWARDPDFAETLCRAESQGVAVYAYTCGLTRECIWLDRKIPVILEKASCLNTDRQKHR